MKNVFCNIIILFFLGAFYSCSKDNLFTSGNQFEDGTLCVNRVSLSDIQGYLSAVKGIEPTKASSLSIEPILQNQDTVMYLVNYEDGWEVLSADIRVPRVLFKCDHGNMSMEELSSCPSRAQFISSLSSVIREGLYSEDFYQDLEIGDAWKDIPSRISIDNVLVRVLASIERTVITSRVQDHLLETRWGQSVPWNMCAPYTDSTHTSRCVLGCVPVAAGQVLYYLHDKLGIPSYTYGSATCIAHAPSNPDHYLTLSPSNIVFSDYSSHWDEMALSRNDSTGFSQAAAFLLYVGYRYGAHYYTDLTYASNYSTPSVFSTYFGIDCQYETVNNLNSFANLIEDQIYTDEMPIMLGVRDTVRHVGHSVVLDGSKYLEELVTYYYEDYITLDGHIHPGQTPDYSFTTTETETSHFVAINWGWNGSYDEDSSGNTIWYNVFTSWIVASRAYSNKETVVYDFQLQ